MMIGVVHISNVEQPNISDIQNLVVSFGKELLKILGRLQQLTKPNHGGQICLPTLQVGASQLHIARCIPSLSLF